MPGIENMATGEEKPRVNEETVTKIESLTREAHQFFQDGDFLNSYLAYEKAADLAQEKSEAFTVRACFSNLGACCVAKGDASKGLGFLLRALPPDDETDGSLNFADLHYNMAVAYDVLGKPDEAKRCYKTALDAYKNCSNVEMEGEALLKLGGTLTSLGLLKEAVKVFQKAEIVFHKLLDKRHEILCISSRASLLAEMKNEQCHELVRNVVGQIEELKNDLLKAKIYSDVGLVYTSTGEFTIAAEYLNKSLNLVQSSVPGDHKLEASVCQNLGAVNNQLGSYVKAIVYHERAIELYGFLGLRYAQGHSFSNLGFACGQLGDLEKSEEYFKHALQAAKDCQDYRGQWQANEGLSALYFQQKDYDRAVSCLKAALAVLPMAGMTDRTIHERIVSKLSNALESQLTSNGKPEVQYKTAIMREKFGTSSDIVAVPTPVSAKQTSVDGSSSKVGHIRPREKNHKLIARGLALDEPASDVDSLSDSTFDSISSFSGSALSTEDEDVRKQSATSNKKDPLNNTYEEPQDLIHVLESGRLRLHDLPPGPRDTVLASLNASDEQNQNASFKSLATKSRTCAMQ